MIAHTDGRVGIIAIVLGNLSAITLPSADSIAGRVLAGLVVTGVSWLVGKLARWAKSKVTK